VCDGLRVPGCWDVLELGECDRVVVVVVDGLGQWQLQAAADIAPTLAAWSTRTITTVFPSTTPTALTSLGTGVGCGQHGIVGAAFRLPDSGAVLWPLGWRSEPSPAVVQPCETLWDRAARAGVAVSIVSPRAYAGGGLTGAALRGGQYRGADGPGERITEIAAAVTEGGRSLTYGYWEALDRTAHVHGPASQHYRDELAVAEAWVVRLAESLPAGTRLVITADHGVVDCPDQVDLDGSPELEAGVSMVAGEPRMRHIYVQPGRGDEVAATWQAILGAAAHVHTRDDAVANGWFGEVEPDMAARIGDVIAVAAGTFRLAAPSRDSIVSSLRGQHGALTPAEMEIPLAVVDL
jgi:Type I phosphodiesterase / nucleotide pyrophosphatase